MDFSEVHGFIYTTLPYIARARDEMVKYATKFRLILPQAKIPNT